MSRPMPPRLARQTFESASSRAFTLIEVLIVLALLAVVAGVGTLAVSAFVASSETATDEIDAMRSTLRCTAAQADTVIDDDCEPYVGGATPVALSIPELGPRVESIELTPTGGQSTVGSDRVFLAYVEDSDGLPFAEAEVRWELTVDGVPQAPTSSQSQANGIALRTVSLAQPGAITLVACAMVNGQAPASCADDGVVASNTVAWSWVVRPTLVSFDASGREATVTWRTQLVASPAGNRSGYLLFSDAACTEVWGGTGGISGFDDTITVDGDPATTFVLDFDGAGPPVFNSNRWVRIDADTEFTVGSEGNLAVGCFLASEGAPDPDPDPDPNPVPTAVSLAVNPPAAAAETGETATFTVTLLDQGEAPYELGASVRWEVNGSTSLPSGASADAVTDASGVASLSYSRASEQTDTIRVCVAEDGGTPPNPCPTSGSLTASTSFEWLDEAIPDPDPPVFVSLTNTSIATGPPNNRRAQVVVAWDTAVQLVGGASGYQIHSNAGCTSAIASGSTRVPGGITANVTVNFPLTGSGGQTTIPNNPGGSRWLRIAAGTEAVDGYPAITNNVVCAPL